MLFPQSAYIHIPFCRRRCFYCDFPIAVAGDRARGETSSRMQTYVNTLCREIQAAPVIGPALRTVFFGGGTPSLLSVTQIEQILGAVRDRFGIAHDAEISIEMDPGTFNRATLETLRHLSINRVSLGVQSFQDAQLEACGRTHRVQDVDQAIEDLQAIAIPTWSLDLISGLPHQTIADWELSLGTAIAVSPPHISVYDLTVEPGTVFNRRYVAGQSPLPSDDATTHMYRMAQSLLTQAGYQHYEISNYAQPGHQCQHNRVYWENKPCYGFGMGAASYTQQQRFNRPRTTHEYDAWVEAYCQADGKLDCPPATRTDQWLDRLMMGLRLAEGIRLDELVAEFGPDLVDRLKQCLAPYCRKGWVALSEPPSPTLRLTDPEGFLFSNVVLVKLFETFSDP
ncbi:radical SAM family heme chaperone HemW [Oscillatoria sp. CS-180]|uniref:radical SAM family heme chaperone HemW n=1 Tax=Oscillatoria sp. CS-180 TaxID=3021720 RepID=UPI00232C77B2|nr:radical SAM family heme chaperone HemW [Oscillatoria sp. CS-180]MDB9529516.1 radical SAM family heme chaperone HemW [Oscillatoria sp. CS-180]